MHVPTELTFSTGCPVSPLQVSLPPVPTNKLTRTVGLFADKISKQRPVYGAAEVCCMLLSVLFPLRLYDATSTMERARSGGVGDPSSFPYMGSSKNKGRRKGKREGFAKAFQRVTTGNQRQRLPQFEAP